MLVSVNYHSLLITFGWLLTIETQLIYAIVDQILVPCVAGQVACKQPFLWLKLEQVCQQRLQILGNINLEVTLLPEINVGRFLVVFGGPVLFQSNWLTVRYICFGEGVLVLSVEQTVQDQAERVALRVWGGLGS